MKKGHAGNTVTAYDEGNMKHGSSAVLLMQNIASSIRSHGPTDYDHQLLYTLAEKK